MMHKNVQLGQKTINAKIVRPPMLKVVRVGVVSRDYSRRFQNGRRDFSATFREVLKILDEKRCDVVLFSLYSLGQRHTVPPRGLRHVRTVMYEEFIDGKKRHAQRYVVAQRRGSTWGEYELRQVFGTLSGNEHKLAGFVREEVPRRILGNCCVLLCGETNGVKYSPKAKSVHDVFGLRKAIPKEANVILNPVHDRMTRFEMKLKRRFLSEHGRWVLSVWNKGKKDKNGRTKDGTKPAWTVFFDGKEKEIRPLANELGVEIGVVDLI